MKYSLLKYGVLLVMLHTLAYNSFSQGLSSNYGNFTPCSGPVALYTFDFTATVNNSITQANISIQNSDNQCCSEPSNAGCLFFNVIVDPNAIGVVFQQTGAGGNVSIYYDNCGTVFPANTNICLDPANAYVDPVTGQTYHRFMFCRSGQTTYDFTFNQLVVPTASPDIVTAIGCNQTLQVTGLTNPVWTSVSPGSTGQYNNLLSCTSCSTTIYTPIIGTPQTLIYEVSGTISSPCTATLIWSDQVSVTTYPTLFASPGSNVSICNGSIVGTTVSATAIGGTAPYTYSWTGPNGFTDVNTHNSTIDNTTVLQPGVYTVVISDGTGCPSATTSVTVTLFNNDIVANAGLDQTVCSTPAPIVSINGSVSATGTGTWSGGNGNYNSSTTDLTLLYTPSAAEIASGSVTLTLTPTNNGGCPFTTDQVTINFVQFTVSVSGIIENVSCFGLSDGAIDLSVNGGAPISSYSWSPNGQLTQDVSGLSAGSYSVLVTDINGCSQTSNFTITQPTVLSGLDVGQINVSCFGGIDGSVSVQGAGGTTNYTYTLGVGAPQPSGIFAGLAAGNYTITISDAEGCNYIMAANVTEPTPLSVALDNQTNILCFGGTTGGINITSAGGTPTYNYSWTGPNGFTSTAEDLTGLVAGAYNLTVTDANGTTGGCLAALSVTLTEPLAPLSVALDNQTNILCFGGTTGEINITAAGGTPTYNYSWIGPYGFTSTAKDLTGLVAGAYNLTVTDANGTTGGCLAALSVTLTEPLAPLSVALDNQTNILCFGGTTGEINITAAGGTPTYNYSWTGPNGFTSTVEDLTGLVAGAYNLTVTDANGTTGGCLAALTVSITQPQAVLPIASVVSNYNGEDISCAGVTDGEVSVSVSGGTPNYSYEWFNSAGILLGNTQTLNNIGFGTYTVIVTDQNSCQEQTDVIVNDPLDFVYSTSITSNFNGEEISCFGASDGSIDLTLTGGTPTYTYTWTNSSNNIVSSLQDPANLSVGTYEVEVTDLNGCSFTTSISLTQPDQLGAVASVTSDYNGAEISCFQATDGSMTVNVAGGTPIYSYSWFDNLGSQIGTSLEQSNVGAGSYTVQITDINGCQITVGTIVSEPTPVTSAAQITSNCFGVAISCVGENDGSASVVGGGGVPGYSYLWNTTPVQSGTQAINLGEGTCTVTVTDLNGCTASSQVILTANPLPEINIPPSIDECVYNSIILQAPIEPGGLAVWEFSDGQTFTGFGPHEYNFSGNGCADLVYTLTNAQGCVNQQLLEDYTCPLPSPIASFTHDPMEINSFDNGVNFTNTSLGADNYLWIFGDGSPNETIENPYHEYEATDDFIELSFQITLVAYSAEGCVDTAINYINLVPALIYYVPNAFTPDGDDHNNLFKPVFSAGYSVDKYSFMIFNRWGEVIYETQDIAAGWDGTYKGLPSQEGVYTWKIQFMKSNNAFREMEVGHVTLLRGSGID
jgi:gliding motility-associated-like protein